MVNILDVLPKRLKQARLEAGLTMEELADMIGVSHNVTVSRYESGKRMASIGIIQQIAKATGKEIGWFFEEAPVEKKVYAQSEAEQQLIKRSRQLNENGLERLNEYLEFLFERYRKRV